MKLVDSHAHLGSIHELAPALARAENARVTDIIAVGSDVPSNQQVLELSGPRGNLTIHAAMGIHPWKLDPAQVEAGLDLIQTHVHALVGIGEIGLDYWLKDAKKDPLRRKLQQQVFERLLALSRQYDKPAVLHTRGAWNECFQMVRQARVQRAVFHWYSGPLDVLENILSHGYFISATPAARYSRHHQAAIAKSPIQKILLETDTPVAYEGVRAEPAHVLKSLEAVAHIKNMETEDVARITTCNAIDFFGLKG